MYGASHQHYAKEPAKDPVRKRKGDYSLVTLIQDYRPQIPVTEIEPLREMIPLKRDHIPYGIRGYCFAPGKVCYVHQGDSDTHRVHYHEDLHLRIARFDPHHKEGEIRMLEDWRLGREEMQENDYGQEEREAA